MKRILKADEKNTEKGVNSELIPDPKFNITL
jgi:hypothetical protein